MNADFSSASTLLLEHGFRQESVSAILEHHVRSRVPNFQYPWSDLEQKLSDAGAERIYLVGYGSLLNPQSAARSIRNTPADGHPPVVALGARRLFNYRMPEAMFVRYGVTPGLLDRAALNAEPDHAGVVNGRLITFSVSDLPELRVRETAYDLQPVTCLPWNESDTRPFTAFAFCCAHEFWEGKPYVDNTLQPYQPYYDLCRAGAGMVSPQFLSFYLKTTFLADRRTTAFDSETRSNRSNAIRT